MNTKVMLSVIVTAMLLGSYQAQAVLGNARATMKVVTAIAVTNVSDLVFNEAAAGAAAETIDHDTFETANNASFNVTGEPNRAITITLPADGTVKMAVNGGGDADHEIAVDQFTSNTPAQIDASGTTALYVGATRAALSATQASGDYEGNFAVDVVYQ